MTRAREAHGGGAAELAEQHVNRILAVGELGAGQAQITADALHDGAGFYARVRDDMNALPPVEGTPVVPTNDQTTKNAEYLGANWAAAIG